MNVVYMYFKRPSEEERPLGGRHRKDNTAEVQRLKEVIQLMFLVFTYQYGHKNQRISEKIRGESLDKT